MNQGQEDKVLPIASSIAYAVTDSLGNLICPRDPQRKLLGYKQIVANQGSVTSVTDVTGLAIPFIAPTGRKIKVTSYAQIGNATGSQTNFNQITEGATELQAGDVVNIATGTGNPVTLTLERILTPSAGLHTYKLRAANAGGTTTVVATSTAPTFIKVELA